MVHVIRYGDDAAQFGELSVPHGKARGIAVIIHGGFWRNKYTLVLGRPLAADLLERQWAVWNIEYRRVGTGGGWPATFNDVAAAIDALAAVGDLDTSHVVAIGHSAGGLLATWATLRSTTVVSVDAVISQAGVLNVGEAARQRIGDGAIHDFLGDSVATVPDPTLTPPKVPVWCVHARDDEQVPFGQSESFVESAREQGSPAQLAEVAGGHFGMIDPNHSAWHRTCEVLEKI